MKHIAQRLITAAVLVTVTLYAAPAIAQPWGCPCSIWVPTDTPTTASATDNNVGNNGGVELGVTFRSSVDGFATGVRYYRGGAQNSGPHIGSVWDPSAPGTPLAQATFTNETTSGWQQVDFATAATLEADTNYVASYHSETDGYAFDQCYFDDPAAPSGVCDPTDPGFPPAFYVAPVGAVDNPPLRALEDGELGGSNGIAAYSDNPTFPTGSFTSTNYWVDVVFAACDDEYALAGGTGGAPGPWQQFALACDPGAADTVGDVLGDDVSGTYDADWVVFEWDPTTQTYTELTLTSSLVQGRGYWIRSRNAANLDFGDGAYGVINFPLTSDATNGRFNLVGHPFPFEVCWEDALVFDGTTALTLDQADPVVGMQRACSIVPPDPSCVMSRTMWKYNGNSYDSFDGNTIGAEGELEASDGLWVRAFDSGISLRVPLAPGSNCTTGGGSAPVGNAPSALEELRGWHVRLIAESGDLADRGAVFGQLPDSGAGPDLHDLEELPPFANPHLTVVFPHPEWGAYAGDYSTDFHALGGRGRDRWSFDVVASVPGEEITLRWEGPDEILRRSFVLDQQTRQMQRVLPGGSYTFTMNGGRRGFTWILRGGGPPSRGSNAAEAPRSAETRLVSTGG